MTLVAKVTMMQMCHGCGDFLPTSCHGPWDLIWIHDFWYRDTHHRWHTALHGGHRQAEPNVIQVWQAKSKPYLL